MADTTKSTEPMSRRDAWLTIALAIARDGLPAPDEVHIRGGWAHVSPGIDVIYAARKGQPNARPAADVLHDAKTAAAILDLQEPYEHPDGIRWERCAMRRGWRWSVSAWLPEGTVYDAPASEPPPSPLAAQVIAAIEPEDPEDGPTGDDYVEWLCDVDDRCTFTVAGPRETTQEAIDAHLDEHLDAEGIRHYPDTAAPATVVGAR